MREKRKPFGFRGNRPWTWPCNCLPVVFSGKGGFKSTLVGTQATPIHEPDTASEINIDQWAATIVAQHEGDHFAAIKTFLEVKPICGMSWLWLLSFKQGVHERMVS